MSDEKLLCNRPPAGWYCGLPRDHEGPCPAWPVSHHAYAKAAPMVYGRPAAEGPRPVGKNPVLGMPYEIKKRSPTRTRVWIDCEWNDYQGELISMALVDEDGFSWYRALECKEPSEWVRDNVLPVLGTNTVSKAEFRKSLEEWLAKYPEIHIIADWPEDIAHFCNVLVTGPGERLDTPPLTMEVVRIETVSDMPHNALFDARAIREAML